MGALYRLDFPSGKSYIGITMGSVESRFREHVRSSNRGAPQTINRAIRKYGAEAVKVVTLAVSNTWGYLQLIEKNAIRVFGTFGKGGYNSTLGGEGVLGRVVPDSERANTSKRFKGKKVPASQAENIRKALLGNKYLLGRKQPPEQLANRKRGIMLAGRGVSFCKQTSKWRAHITVDRRMKHLGRFATEQEALAVRAEAVRKVLAGEPL